MIGLNIYLLVVTNTWLLSLFNILVMMPAYRRNSEFLYTWKNSSLYDDCLPNTIVIWKNSGIVSLVHWATHTGETASFFRMRVSAKSPDRMKRKKPNCLNLREHSGMLLSLVLSLWPERLHKLTKIYFPPAFPRPFRDQDIHLPNAGGRFLYVKCTQVSWITL